MKQPRSGLTLCGMVASLDPDREGVQESVLAARNAGIRVATGFLKGRVMARCCDSSDWMLGSQLGVTIMIGDQFSLIVLLWDLGGFIKLHDFSLVP